MAALGPGIRKIEVENRHAACGEFLQRLGSDALNGAGIGEAKAFGTGVAFLDAVDLLFDPEKIHTRMQSRHAEEERPTMTAKINLQRRHRRETKTSQNFFRFFFHQAVLFTSLAWAMK